jgi:hypothetical protein
MPIYKPDTTKRAGKSISPFTAHKQGRIAGEKAVGGHQEFTGSLDTQVVKVFDLDLSYTPPFSSPWDPVQMSAQAWVKAQWQPRDTIRTRVSARGY